jgi:hypothetical protein
LHRLAKSRRCDRQENDRRRQEPAKQRAERHGDDLDQVTADAIDRGLLGFLNYSAAAREMQSSADIYAVFVSFPSPAHPKTVELAA